MRLKEDAINNKETKPACNLQISTENQFITNFDSINTHKISAYVKYNHYYKEQQNDFKNNPYLATNFYYNATEDYFLCPAGKPMGWVEAYITHTGNGYPSRRDTYHAKNCQECHLQEKCCKSNANHCVEINHALRNYKKQVRELLASQEGKQLYRQRSIEHESVFGQMKANMHYKRFRHLYNNSVN